MWKHVVALAIGAMMPLAAQADGSARGSVKDASPSSRAVWTGVYLGGSVGQRWGNVDWTHNENIGTDENFSVSPSGMIGGGHIGYQHQLGST